jgi:hypothetical protein
MNRVRLKYVPNASWFMCFAVRTSDRVQEIEDRFEEWREKQRCTLFSSR